MINIELLSNKLKYNMLSVGIIFILACLKSVNSITVAPTWVTSSFVKAASYTIITTRTGTGSTPTATMPFSSAFPSPPNLGYGIIDYEGDDMMASEMFQVCRTALTASSFSVKVQITGYTHLYILTVRYIAISRSFPHHLNSFDNVPINYTKGALTNISVSNTVAKYYANFINYTAQCNANGYTYNTFSLPLSNYKILLFLTSLFHSGSNEPASATTGLRPLNMRIATSVRSSSTYLLNVTYGIQAVISRLHFSIIIFDEANVESSKQYYLEYQRIDLTNYGGFIPLPIQFVNNAIIGLTQYSTLRTASCIKFNLKFEYNTTTSSAYGIRMPVSHPKRNMTAFSRFGYTLFYMKTWVCPSGTFFNLTSSLCVSCPVPNCAVCQHISLCRTCKTGYTLNPQDNPLFQCTLNCQIANCLSCASPTVCSVCNMARNYFVNPATGQCVTCSIPNCVQCLTLSTCKTCDQNNDFFLNPYATGTTDQCLPCDIAFCLDCLSATTCSLCDQVNGYFLTTSATSCSPCNMANCTQCLNLNTCKTCDSANGYILDTQGIKCVYCPISNCLKCKSSQECDICDTANNYIVDNNKLCTLCTIPYCLDCNTLTTCTTCNEQLNYFKNPTPTGASDQCILCSIPNCISCTSLTQCKDCDKNAGYSLNATQTNIALQCITCNITNCLQCLSFTLCQFCDYFNGYTLNSSAPPDQQCVLCPISNCLECLNASICNMCDEPNNFFADPVVAGQCVGCTIPQCIQCSTLSTCSQCNESLNYFVNPATTGAADACILCPIPFCIDCLTLAVCSSCNQSANYFLNPAPTSATDQCIVCTLSQCVLCYTLQWCMTCNQPSQYFLNVSTLQCQLCTLPNCVQCKSLETCAVCDNTTGLILNPITGICQPPPPVCGDGIFQFPEICDDGNLINGDGCSSACLVEADYICQPTLPGNSTNTSICYYMGQITIQVILIQKVDNANKVEILFKVQPADLPLWDTLDFSSIVTVSNNTAISSFEVIRNSDGTISLFITYEDDIQNTNITVGIDPTTSGASVFSRLSPISATFTVIPKDNQAALYYDDSVYKMAGMIGLLSQIVAGAALLLFFIGIFVRKLIGVEVMGVVQISYIALVTLCPMNPCFKALTNMWFVNGFNHFSLTKGHLMDPLTPLFVKGISLYSRFFENYNFTLLLIVVPFMVSLICLILAKTVFRSNEDRQNRLLKNAKIISCETAFNGVMFSGYIVGVSAALQIFFGVKSMSDFVGLISVVQSVALLLIFVLYFVLFCKCQQYFGEFTYYFIQKKTVKLQQRQKELQNQQTTKQEASKLEKQPLKKPQQSTELGIRQRINRRWYNILMIQRLCVGAMLIAFIDMTMVIVSALAIYVLLSLYVLIGRPYLKLIHNIRFFFNMLISIAILGIYLFYRMSNCGQQAHSKPTIWFILPFVVLGLLIVCIIYNLTILICEVLQNRESKIKKAQGQKYQEQLNQQFAKVNQEIMRANNQGDRVRGQVLENPLSSGRALNKEVLENHDIIKNTRRNVMKQFKAKETLLNKKVNQASVNQNSLFLAQNPSEGLKDGSQQMINRKNTDEGMSPKKGPIEAQQDPGSNQTMLKILSGLEEEPLNLDSNVVKNDEQVNNIKKIE